MKTKKTLCTVIFLILFLAGFAQKHKVIEKQYFLTDTILQIIVDGPFIVHYTSSDKAIATLMCSPEYAEKVQIETLKKSRVLKLSAKNIKYPKVLVVKVETPFPLHGLELLSGSTFQTNEDINFNDLNVSIVSSSISIQNGTFKRLAIESKGTASVEVGGQANEVVIASKDVSTVDISQLTYNKATIEASNVSNVVLNESGKATISTRNLANIDVSGGGKTEKTTIIVEKSDTLYIEENDSPVISIIGENIDLKSQQGNNYITFFPYEMVINNKSFDLRSPFKHFKRKEKFNGHWGGIEIGVNGYNTPHFDMDFPDEYEYMDLRFPKSVSFYLNLFEYNIPFSKNQKWGMLSGVGFEWHNYRFSHDVWLTGDSSTLRGYYIEGAEVKKSKLMTCYLSIPLIFEYQTNNKSRVNSFHFGLGVVGGVRIGTHSKVKFYENNASYTLSDPVTGAAVPNFYTVLSNKKIKNKDDFFINPFKLDVTARIGWGHINLFATYSIFNMFRQNHGPELYPWSVGIMLFGW